MTAAYFLRPRGAYDCIHGAVRRIFAAISLTPVCEQVNNNAATPELGDTDGYLIHRWALAQSLGQNKTGRDYRAHRGSMQRVSGTVRCLVGPLRFGQHVLSAPEPAKSAPEGASLWDADLNGGF